MTLRFCFTTLAAAILSGCAVAPSAPPPCSAPALVGQKVDDLHTALGVALGQPLSMPECPKYGTGPTATYGKPNQVCWKRPFNLQSCSAIANGNVRIAFPVPDLPIWVLGSEVTARVIDGRLEAIIIATTGIMKQHYAFDDLVVKYGKPAEQETIPFKNQLGASLDSVIAGWKIQDVHVVFFGGFRTADTGKLQIATTKGDAALEADLDRVLKSGRAL